MKRTLLIVRHAKSSWTNPELSDFERPLNERGLKAAPQMGEFMRENGLVPSLVVSSPAVRARRTAELLKDGGGFEAEITYDARIYEASPRTLTTLVTELDDQHGRVMLVGHNPGIEGFIRFLTGESERMPTAAAAVVELDLEYWSDIDEKCCSLYKVYRPKELTGS